MDNTYFELPSIKTFTRYGTLNDVAIMTVDEPISPVKKRKLSSYLSSKTNKTIVQHSVDFCIAVALLLGLIIGYATVGPVVSEIKTKSIVMAAGMRYFINCLFLLPLCILQDCNIMKTTKQKILNTKKLKILGYNILVGLSGCIWVLAMIVDCKYSSVAHGYIIGNLIPVFIVFYRLYLKNPMAKKELIGVIISLIGAIITVSDQSRTKSDFGIYADLGNFVGAIIGAFYFYQMGTIVNYLPTFHLLFIGSFVSWIVCSVYACTVDGIVFFSTDPYSGAFGLFYQKDFLFLLLGLIFSGPFVIICFGLVQYYSDPLLIGLTELTEPFFASLLAYFLGIDKVPSLSTIIGCIIVVIGISIILVIRRKYDTKEFEQLNRLKEVE